MTAASRVQAERIIAEALLAEGLSFDSLLQGDPADPSAVRVWRLGIQIGEQTLHLNLSAAKGLCTVQSTLRALHELTDGIFAQVLAALDEVPFIRASRLPSSVVVKSEFPFDAVSMEGLTIFGVRAAAAVVQSAVIQIGNKFPGGFEPAKADVILTGEFGIPPPRAHSGDFINPAPSTGESQS
jgi:hypothetical protein